MHEIHIPKSTQQESTIIIKLYILPGKGSKKIFSKTETVEIICNCFIFCLLNLISRIIEQNMVTSCTQSYIKTVECGGACQNITLYFCKAAKMKKEIELIKTSLSVNAELCIFVV